MHFHGKFPIKKGIKEENYFVEHCRGASRTTRAVGVVVLLGLALLAGALGRFLRTAVLAGELYEGAGQRALESSWEAALKSRTGGMVPS